MDDILTLLMLIMLQAVLGFDNLLYISLESKRAPKEKQAYVRNLGISIAIVLRIGLLFLLVNLQEWFESVSLFHANWEGVIVGNFTLHAAIVIIGCLLYTSPSPRDKRQSRMPSSA